ncbi:MAG TPA: tetratricopeptide repeat protein [Candidatus Angelobacter sp.]|jgi:Flp pilus assembly protein TadD/tRNA A-37 threonylcarbamoyl transferase component Bud32|nr:tetratricopeptide repeat protein [Candidatus Angelobacter sp.]
MTPEQWERMKEIYKSLFGLPKEEWEALLPKSCEGDEELQNHLRCLLNTPPGFLEREPPRPNGCTDISLSPGEVLSGRWQIVEFLGRGGMAAVYAADDQVLNKRVALKVIRSDSNLLDRFKREVELAQKVKQRNVAAVYDIGRDHRESQDLIFFTMELIPGETMAERLRRNGHLDASEWFPVAKQLCKALQEAHRVKVLHRDLKPGNVMLVGSGKDIRAIVTDFGIARAIDGEQDSRLGLTARSIIMGTWPNGSGTLAYMSPEQKSGKELAETSDIYSLGAVLYEMITGKQYYKFPDLESIPEQEGNWRQVIQQCLADDPEKRFRSAIAVLDELKKTPDPPQKKESIWSTLSRFWRPLPITVTIICLLPIMTVPWHSLPGYVAKVWNRVFLPLPHDIRVAMFLARTKGEKEVETLTAGWIETFQELYDPKDPHLSIIPLNDTIDIPESEIPGAAKRLRFNVYVTISIRKRGNQIDFDLRLQEVGSNRLLRSSKLSIAANDSGSALPNGIAALLERQVSLGPDDLSSQNQQALGFFERGKGYLLHRDVANIDYAVGQFERAVQEDPKFAQAYAYLAFAYSLRYRKTQEQASMANVLLAQGNLIELKRDLPLAHLAAGLISQATGKLDSAVAEFEKVLKLSPSNHEVRGLLSIAYLESGRIDEAKQILREAIELDESDWFNHLDLGYVYYSNGELDNVEKEFRKAVDLAPDNLIANASLAGVCICFGRYDEAEKILNSILASKKSAISEINLAIAYEHTGRYPAAILLLKDATGRKSMNDSYWLELGDAYKLQNMKAKAIQSFRKGFQVAQANFESNPTDSDLRVRIALYNAKLGSRGLALSLLQQAQDATSGKKPLNTEFLLNAARVYELAGKRTQALKVLRSVLHNRCVRSEAEITPDFASLRLDHRYANMVKEIPLR